MGPKSYLVYLLLVFFCSVASSEQLKTVFNPFTGKQDYITRLDSTTLPSGSTQYIQNTFNPTINTQVFSVQQGSFSATGFIMTDASGCQWNTTVATTGALVTTFISCPSGGGGGGTFRPCTTGMSLGILLAITCP